MAHTERSVLTPTWTPQHLARQPSMCLKLPDIFWRHIQGNWPSCLCPGLCCLRLSWSRLAGCGRKGILRPRRWLRLDRRFIYGLGPRTACWLPFTITIWWMRIRRMRWCIFHGLGRPFLGRSPVIFKHLPGWNRLFLNRCRRRLLLAGLIRERLWQL